MPIFRYTSDSIQPVAPATFAELGITERNDLQRLLRDRIDIIAPDTLVIAEEFGNWDDSRRRIDLLAIDRNANLVVIELKRTEDGGHMELQALRYAAMVSTLTFERAVEVFEVYLRDREDDRNAEQTLLAFLGWDEPLDEDFAADVRIVLASAEFSKELTTAVLWLCERSLDIRCVRLRPYGTAEETFLDVQQVIPLPEAEDYQIRVREKAQREREVRRSSRDFTRFDLHVNGLNLPNLSKRAAIHAIVAGLCETGVTPSQIQEVTGWKRNLFFAVEGSIDSKEFVKLAEKNQPFDSSRWHIRDDQLIQQDSQTYAFSNQWGTDTEQIMKRFLEHFQPSHISFQRTV